MLFAQIEQLLAPLGLLVGVRELCFVVEPDLQARDPNVQLVELLATLLHELVPL
jgi:hypothetical protein